MASGSLSVHRRIGASLAAIRARGLLHIMIANISQQAVAFLGVLILAKLLPPDEFALVRIAMAYMAVATIIGAGGLTAPVLRYCADPAFDAAGRRRILGAGLKRLVLVSMATLVGVLLLVLISGRGRPESLVLAAYAMQIPALAAGSLLLVYFQAVQRFRFLAYSQVGIRLVSFFITTAAAWLYGLMGFLVAAWLAALLACLPLLLAARPLSGAVAAGLPSDFFLLARYSLLGMVITTAGQYADLMMLDWVGTDRSQVAVYSLATIFFFAVSALAGAVQSVATPGFTGLMGNPEAFRARLRRWSLLLSGAGVLASLGVVAVAWGVEHWVLGRPYEGLALMVAVLMLRFCLWCTYAVGGAALVGIGAIRQGTGIATATTLLALIVGYPLCLALGVWGAAWTQVVVALGSVLLVWRLIRREMLQLVARAPLRVAPGAESS